jgi:hypothetical protein
MSKVVVPTHQFRLVIRSGNRVLVLFLKRRGGIKCEGIMTSDIGMCSKLWRRR